jgi:uncharacterized protein (DUF1697 family)
MVYHWPGSFLIPRGVVALTTHIALLRAVNVAGRNKVGMADLRDLLAELGFANVQSLLQSGNLVFDSQGRTPARLETLLEQAARDRLELDTGFFVRTAREWAEIVAGNPFPTEAKRDPAHLVVMCLKAGPDGEHVAALERAIADREVVRAVGRQLYVVYRDGIGRSRLTNALIEHKLATQGTGRNWNTVLKLASIAA